MPLQFVLNPETGRIEAVPSDLDLDTDLLSAPSGVAIPSRASGGLLSGLLADAITGQTQRRLARIAETGELTEGTERSLSIADALSDRGKFMDAMLGGFFGRALDLLLARGAGHRLAQQTYQNLIEKAAEDARNRATFGEVLAVPGIVEPGGFLDPTKLRAIPGLVREVVEEVPVTRTRPTGEYVEPPPVTLGRAGETLQEIAKRAEEAGAVRRPEQGPREFLGGLGARIEDPRGVQGGSILSLAASHELAQRGLGQVLQPGVTVVAPTQGPPAPKFETVTEIEKRPRVEFNPNAVLTPFLTKVAIAAISGQLPPSIRQQLASSQVIENVAQAQAAGAATRLKEASIKELYQSALESGMNPYEAAVFALGSPEHVKLLPESPYAKKAATEAERAQQELQEKQLLFPINVAQEVQKLNKLTLEARNLDLIPPEHEKLLKEQIKLAGQRIDALKDEKERAEAALRLRGAQIALQALVTAQASKIPLETALPFVNTLLKDLGFEFTVTGVPGLFDWLKQIGRPSVSITPAPKEAPVPKAAPRASGPTERQPIAPTPSTEALRRQLQETEEELKRLQ